MKKSSIKADKSKDDWVVAIFCDYGKPDQKRMIRASYSLESGSRAWDKFVKIFSRNNYRCWQETKKGKIVKDSKGETKLKEKL